MYTVKNTVPLKYLDLNRIIINSLKVLISSLCKAQVPPPSPHFNGPLQQKPTQIFNKVGWSIGFSKFVFPYGHSLFLVLGRKLWTHVRKILIIVFKNFFGLRFRDTNIGFFHMANFLYNPPVVNKRWYLFGYALFLVYKKSYSCIRYLRQYAKLFVKLSWSQRGMMQLA